MTTPSVRTRSGPPRGLQLLAIAILALSVANCAESEDEAAQTCVQRLASQSPAQTTTPTVMGVCDDNRFTVVFSMFKNGSEVTVEEGDAGFILARLVPTEEEALPQYWQSYINRIEDPEPGAWPQDDPAVQATTETGGTLTDLGNGIFAYTFETDIRNVTHPTEVAYVPEQTHRVGIEFRGETEDPELGNPTYSWRPSLGTDPVTDANNKNVVLTESCNECHGQLRLHGGPRTDTEFCVLCHNPGSIDANSGNSVDFSNLIHKIHRRDLPRGEFVIWGYRDSKHDYSHASFPQDQQNCRKCHDPEVTPDGNNFKEIANQDTCTTCHNNVSFAAAADVPANTPTCAEPNPSARGAPFGLSTDLCLHTGGAQANSSTCLACHGEGGQAGIDMAHATIFETPNNPLTPGDVPQLEYEIVEAAMANATQPTVTFRILADGERLDIKNMPSNVTLGSARLRTVWSSPEGTVGSPVDWNNRGQAIGLPPAITIEDHLATIDNIGDNTFQTQIGTVPTAPTDAVMVSVSIVGRMGVKVDDAGSFRNFGPKSQILEVVGGPRRQIVDINKCNTCHERLALHGDNRVDNPQVCVYCHNPNATDIEVRPTTVDANDDDTLDQPGALGIDGKLETPIDFREMIHAIHAGSSRDDQYVVYGFGRSTHDYSHVTFPGDLKNCTTCHLEGTYTVPIPSGSLATTRLTVDPTDPSYGPAVGSFSGFSSYPQTVPELHAALENPLDDWNKSPTGSACTACHATPQARAHAQVSEFFWSTDLAGTGIDSCATCHSESGTFPVSKAHGIAAPSEDGQEAPPLISRR